MEVIESGYFSRELIERLCREFIQAGQGEKIFVSGNLPLKTEITTLLIMTKLEQFDYAGATAIAAVMLAMSFLILLAINLLQGWNRRRGAVA